MENNINDSLPLIFLNEYMPFPETIESIDIKLNQAQINEFIKAVATDQFIVLANRKSFDAEDILDNVYKYVVLAKIVQTTKVNDGISRVTFASIKKAEIYNIFSENGVYYADVNVVDDKKILSSDFEDERYIEAMVEELVSLYKDFAIRFNKNISAEDRMFIKLSNRNINELIMKISSTVIIDAKDRNDFLGIDGYHNKYKKLVEVLNDKIYILQIKEEIESKTKDIINKNQRDYYLREQMQVIKKELNLAKDTSEDYEIYKDKINNLPIDKESKEKLVIELDKLRNMHESSQEYGVIENYIQTVLKYPWGITTNDNLDIKNAKKILDEDHYKLDEVKERILEFLAIKHFNKSGRSPILCLVGPPGTGKTSIAKSISRALERKMFRVSLGGMRDEAEIRGHRKTYVGAMPGRLVKGIIQVKSTNPIILLDEIDKIGDSHRGDPAAALLEVLDYQQNNQFVDNYMEIPVDLSNAFFITTANSMSTIPEPLLDRMEIIEVNSYTGNEKFHIAKDYLLKRKLREYSLEDKDISISDEAIKYLIDCYVREAGVRKLESTIGALLRRIAKDMLLNDKDFVKITKKQIVNYLGKEKYREDSQNREDSIGIVNGLAYTRVGGCTLQIEVNITKGSGQLNLTGQMGDVMKESAMIAKNYVMSNFDMEDDFYASHNIHIHIPEGAIPKDGPSAGIAMTSAILSAVLKKKARADVCMTGEVTLRGRVLPIGGLREKLLAARNANLRQVLVPFDNKADVMEIDKEITKKLDIVYVKDMREVIPRILVDNDEN